MEQFGQQIESFIHSDWLTTAITAVVIIAVTAVCARLVRRFMRKLLRFNEEKDLPSSSIFINIARAAVWVLGVCIMLSTCFNVDVSAAVTALGIGGIAISLGFQDTLSNLIGGLQVSLMRIIKPGDNIEVGSSSGVVKDITWRHTTIRNSAGEEVIIPNSIIGKNALTHLPPTNQVKLPVVIITDGDHLSEVAEAIEHAAAEAAGKVAKLTKQPALTLTAIGSTGFEGTIVFRVADSRTAARAGDEVLRAIAPLTRQHAPQKANEVLKEAQLEATAAAKDAKAHPKAKSKVKPASKHTPASHSSFRNRMARAFRLSKEQGNKHD